MSERDYEAELQALSCADSSCRIARRKGMNTNGGCRCGSRSMHGPLDGDAAFKVWSALSIRRAQVASLTTERDAARSQAQALRKALRTAVEIADVHAAQLADHLIHDREKRDLEAARATLARAEEAKPVDPTRTPEASAGAEHGDSEALPTRTPEAKP